MMIKAKLRGFQEHPNPLKLDLPLVNYMQDNKWMTEVYDQDKHELEMNDLMEITDHWLKNACEKLDGMLDV